MLIQVKIFSALFCVVAARRSGRPSPATTARPTTVRSNFCQAILDDDVDVINGAITMAERLGAVDYLFDDSYEDFSLVDLYKMARDTVHHEYEAYEIAKSAAASQPRDTSFADLMSDPSKSK